MRGRRAIDFRRGRAAAARPAATCHLSLGRQVTRRVGPRFVPARGASRRLDLHTGPVDYVSTKRVVRAAFSGAGPSARTWPRFRFEQIPVQSDRGDYPHISVGFSGVSAREVAGEDDKRPHVCAPRRGKVISSPYVAFACCDERSPERRHAAVDRPGNVHRPGCRQSRSRLPTTRSRPGTASSPAAAGTSRFVISIPAIRPSSTRCRRTMSRWRMAIRFRSASRCSCSGWRRRGRRLRPCWRTSRIGPPSRCPRA